MKIYIARFIGYCNIAISEDKNKVKDYVKNIRKIDKDDYKIFSKDISDEDILMYSERPEYITTSSYGLEYTNIDWFILRKEFELYVSDLIITRDTLEDTILNMGKVISNNGMDSLRESLDEIKGLLKRIDKPGSDRDEVVYQFYKRNDIHYMDIMSYLSYTKWHEDAYKQYIESTGFPT